MAKSIMTEAPRIWDRFLTERDKEVFKLSGYGKRGGSDKRPALFIIDVQYNFCGDQPEDILEGIKKYRTHCRPEAWDAVAHIERLLHLAREKNLPIFYTESARRKDLKDSGVQVGKNYRGQEKTVIEGTHATTVVHQLAPQPQDMLIGKRKLSCFFGTLFMSQLNFLDVDTLILTGGTTPHQAACGRQRWMPIPTTSRPSFLKKPPLIALKPAMPSTCSI